MTRFGAAEIELAWADPESLIDQLVAAGEDMLSVYPERRTGPFQFDGRSLSNLEMHAMLLAKTLGWLSQAEGFIHSLDVFLKGDDTNGTTNDAAADGPAEGRQGAV